MTLTTIVGRELPKFILWIYTLLECRLSAAIIMSTMYGYDVAPKGDYFVGLAERAVARLSARSPPDATLFFSFPILRYLPSWFPGTQFKKFALEGKMWAYEMRDIPLGFVQKQIVKFSILCKYY